MKTYYLIRESINEDAYAYTRICESLEEAESHVMEHADYGRAKGTCTIHKVDENFDILEILKYSKGELLERVF